MGVSLLLHNTFGIEAEASEFLEYHSEDELRHWISEGVFRRRPYFCIGQGSNLLLTRSRYDWTFLHSAIRSLEVTKESPEHVHVRVGSGVVWDDFVQYCVQNGWYGAENLSLIPGEVGAASVQNIGAYGVEVKDLIDSVETLDVQGVRRVYQASECAYVYRGSIFKSPSMKSVFVLYVNFRLSKQPHYTLDYGNVRQELEAYPEVTLENVRRVIMEIRKRKLPDPAVWGNAGSFFKNPVIPRMQYERLLALFPQIPSYDVDAERVKVPAGWLIEQAGWKGKTWGKVGVHDRQALVLINRGGALGSEVVELAEAIQKSVSERFGIDIQPEVNYL